jgi:sugar lactone lactonase YvrE
LYFGEGPRWHDGRLWFSDFYDHAVKSMDSSGRVTVEHRLDDQPSGLGWLPDGRLLVVSMREMKVLRQEGGGFVLHADLQELARHQCNDMVVDGVGRAWVGNFGFDLDADLDHRGAEAVMADHPSTNLVRVDPDGAVHLAAAEMHFPNGTVVTPDGSTLVVAETLGLCIWVANALAPECVLLAAGGEVLQTVATSQNCYACMLGGEDGKDLYLVTAETSHHATASAKRTGKIETVRVDAPGAGWP